MAEPANNFSSSGIARTVQHPADRNPWDPSRGTVYGHAQSTGLDVDTLPLRENTPASVFPDGRHTLSGTSIRAFGLGLALGLCTLSTIFLAVKESPLWRAPFFLAVLSLFHFLEFYTTAAYNTPFATVDAFLLTTNGSAYNAAHTLALLETIAMHSMFSYPSLLPKNSPIFIVAVGMILLLVGQGTRSLAMVQAGTNFNHTVQQQKTKGHKLVTTGLYGILRHPSYFGFFWWGLGSQLVLGNVVCFVGYTLVLWHFFNQRITREEELLVEFFGQEYVQYRARTFVGIPLIW